MTSSQSTQFFEQLRRAGHLKDQMQGTGDDGAAESLPDTVRPGVTSASKPWEVTNLTASEFADEAALYFRFERVTLQEMLQAAPLVRAFSQRFLRETLVFPYETADHGAVLVIADPTDLAAKRAAEIVLGPNFDIKIAAFDDLAVVLEHRLGDDKSEDLSGPDGSRPLREDDIESLRDLASGAPVVRAVNDLLEKAVEQRASDIHIEPFPTGLVVRLRVDGLLRPIAPPLGVLPQALISRIKIVASLNIAERRLPQDGAARLRVGRSELDIRVAIMPAQHGESAVILEPFADSPDSVCGPGGRRRFQDRLTELRSAASLHPPFVGSDMGTSAAR